MRELSPLQGAEVPTPRPERPRPSEARPGRGLFPLLLVGAASAALALSIWGFGRILGLGEIADAGEGGSAQGRPGSERAVPVRGAPRSIRPPLRLVVAPVISPESSLVLYRGLATYLQSTMGERIQLMPRESYSEVNSLLRQQKCEAAIICTYPFVLGERDFGLQAIAAPQIEGKAVYYSYIVARAGVPGTSLGDLRGKRFASASVISNTGWIYPKHWLVTRGLDPHRFFEHHLIAGSHDRALLALLHGEADAAAVDSLVFDRMRRENVELRRRVRILQRSPPFGSPPFVVARHVDRRARDRLQDALLRAHEHPQGRRALNRLGVERFVVPDPKLYESTREMMRDLERVR